MERNVKKSLSLLLAEDEPVIATHLSQLLREMGHGLLHVAHSAREAIAKAEELRPDLVLMDIALPGDMDGIEAAAVLQDRLRTPVIFLTGATDAATIERAVRIQPYGYVAKPFREVEIRCAIEIATERHRVESTLQLREMVLMEYAELLRSQASIDELTGLYNRNGFMTLGRQHLKSAERHHRSWTLLFLDLNGLKRVNDTLGHEAGDLLLTDMAQVLRDTFRESDVMARLGGDEFVVLALESPAAGGLNAIARLRSRIDDHNRRTAVERRLSVSIGCAVPNPAEDEEIETLLSRADAQMYLEKRASRI